MLRDITMIIAVLVAAFSVGFGIYERVDANNAKGFAYEQAYRVLNVVQRANITPFQRATIADAALDVLGTPPPVIDLSRSSAAVPPTGACTPAQQRQCTIAAADLATANSACKRADATACSNASALQRSIIQQNCIQCFSPTP